MCLIILTILVSCVVVSRRRRGGMFIAPSRRQPRLNARQRRAHNLRDMTIEHMTGSAEERGCYSQVPETMPMQVFTCTMPRLPNAPYTVRHTLPNTEIARSGRPSLSTVIENDEDYEELKPGLSNVSYCIPPARVLFSSVKPDFESSTSFMTERSPTSMSTFKPQNSEVFSEVIRTRECQVPMFLSNENYFEEVPLN
jgi:hypothetical protein